VSLDFFAPLFLSRKKAGGRFIMHQEKKAGRIFIFYQEKK
jgi:hypothetical protein